MVLPPAHIVVLPVMVADGGALTVTVTLPVAVVAPEVTVTLYVVVAVGLAVGLATVVLLKPVAGDQL